MFRCMTSPVYTTRASRLRRNARRSCPAGDKCFGTRTLHRTGSRNPCIPVQFTVKCEHDQHCNLRWGGTVLTPVSFNNLERYTSTAFFFQFTVFSWSSFPLIQCWSKWCLKFGVLFYTYLFDCFQLQYISVLTVHLMTRLWWYSLIS